MNTTLTFIVIFFMQAVFFFGYTGLFILNESVPQWIRNHGRYVRRIYYINTISPMRCLFRIAGAYCVSMTPVAASTEVLNTHPLGAFYITISGCVLILALLLLPIFSFFMRKEEPIPSVRIFASIVMDKEW